MPRRNGRAMLTTGVGLALGGIALGGCAAFPPIVSGLSGAITIREWVRARPHTGLPAPDNGASDPRNPAETPQAGTDPSQAALENAYRQGVRDAVRQLTEGLGRDPRWTWVAPVVQEVWVPPQVVNGVFIPGHREWVMIRPGQWQAQFGLPLGTPPTVRPTGGQPASPGLPAPAR